MMIHSTEAATFVEGLERAEELVTRWFEKSDPDALRSAAAVLEASSTDAYSFGFARGLRILAAQEVDRLESFAG